MRGWPEINIFICRDTFEVVRRGLCSRIEKVLLGCSKRSWSLLIDILTLWRPSGKTGLWVVVIGNGHALANAPDGMH